MKLNYYIVNPGGNITAIVPGKFTEKSKLKINKKILNLEPTVEQVGFWVKPKNKSTDARLEMAGGEFCGNALRSIGAVLRLKTNKKFFLVESSGTEEVVKVILSKSLSSLKISTKNISFLNNVCKLPGISHIVTEKVFTKGNAKNFLKDSNLLKEKAAGVISYEKAKNYMYKINPIVWVSGTRTLYRETACASGTIALAYMLFLKDKVEILKIIQPSGAIFEVFINKRLISLTGPIINVHENQLLF